MNHFKGKTVLFAVPTYFGFSDVIKLELEKVGFHVYDFSHIVDRPYRYKNIWKKLHNCCRKVFYNDYENKQRLLREFREGNLLKELDNVPCVDYFFCIRPDFFPLRFVEQAREKANFSAAYQWDGMKRFPDAMNYIDKFDRFFIFDPDDSSIPGTSLTTNFCPGQEKQAISMGNVIKGHSFFLGSYVKERFDDVVAVEEALGRAGVENDFYVCADKRKDISRIKKHNLRHIRKPYDYTENIEMVQSASILVDIHNPVHQGLSFRAFEALKFKKKLVTTNVNIKQYDFYRPENIFVWGVDDASGLENFINTPLVEVLESIRQKYYFENWIKNVLSPKDNATDRFSFEQANLNPTETLVV